MAGSGTPGHRQSPPAQPARQSRLQQRQLLRQRRPDPQALAGRHAAGPGGGLFRSAAAAPKALFPGLPWPSTGAAGTGIHPLSQPRGTVSALADRTQQLASVDATPQPCAHRPGGSPRHRAAAGRDRGLALQPQTAAAAGATAAPTTRVGGWEQLD